MRILYISQYFPPEAGASQARAYELARNLVLLGHQVTMLAEIPNHPSGIIPPQYRGKLYARSNMDDIDVRHLWVKASPVKNYRSRLLFYASFMVSAAVAGLFLTPGSFDVVYVNSPPLLAGGSGLVISLLRRIPMVFEVCDLWPESAIMLGEMKNQRAIHLATMLEEACYRHSRKIVVVTHGVQERLLQRGIPANKLALIPNGANTDLFKFSLDEREKWRDQLNCQDKFVALYAGLHGLAQGLETIIEAAKWLQDDRSIHFLLVGEGPCKPEIVDLARRYQLENITFLSERPREDIPGLQSAADAAIIPLKEVSLFKDVVPSKVFDAWACQRPVIMSVDGEARRLLENIQGGLFTPPEDAIKMANAVSWLKNHPEEREKMGANGRTYTVQNHSHPELARKLAKILSQDISPD